MVKELVYLQTQIPPFLLSTVKKSIQKFPSALGLSIVLNIFLDFDLEFIIFGYNSKINN